MAQALSGPEISVVHVTGATVIVVPDTAENEPTYQKIAELIRDQNKAADPAE